MHPRRLGRNNEVAACEPGQAEHDAEDRCFVAGRQVLAGAKLPAHGRAQLVEATAPCAAEKGGSTMKMSTKKRSTTKEKCRRSACQTKADSTEALLAWRPGPSGWRSGGRRSNCASGDGCWHGWTRPSVIRSEGRCRTTLRSEGARRRSHTRSLTRMPGLASEGRLHR